MLDYQLISNAASTLLTEEETLLGFQRNGWITTVRRNDSVFLASDQTYRAKYILYLTNTRKLTDKQIGTVVDFQRPPYSAAQVDEILRREADDPKLDRADA